MNGPYGPLCHPCTLARMAWLDYRLPRRLSFVHGSGAAYDSSPAGIRDAQKARFEEWRNTVRESRAQIADLCRRGHHSPPGPGGGSSGSTSRYASGPSL